MGRPVAGVTSAARGHAGSTGGTGGGLRQSRHVSAPTCCTPDELRVGHAPPPLAKGQPAGCSGGEGVGVGTLPFWWQRLQPTMQNAAKSALSLAEGVQCVLAGSTCAQHEAGEECVSRRNQEDLRGRRNVSWVTSETRQALPTYHQLHGNGGRLRRSPPSTAG